MSDANEIDAPLLSADVCVIGAGPSGLTVAAELAQAGIDVIVLEAGGQPYDRHERRNLRKILVDHVGGAQSLARGGSTGEPYYPLRLARARGLAGSANALMAHGLRARPLDAVDFSARFGSPWPISHDELLRHIPEAELYAGIREAGTDPVVWTPQKLTAQSGEAQKVFAAPFRHGNRGHFPRLATRLAESKQPHVVSSAVVTGFKVDRSSKVAAVEVASLRGASFGVVADVFVLAAGGIDNARLMLGSRPLLYPMDAAADLVGRHFMEHLHFVSGYVVPKSPEAAEEIRALFGDPGQPKCWLTPADEVVVQESLLRAAFAALPVHESSLIPAVPAAGELMRIGPYGPYGLRARLGQLGTAIRGGHHVIGATLARARREEKSVFALGTMTEQMPDPDSQVTLSSRRDQMGMSLPTLRWQVGERDFLDARRSTEVLAEDFERLGLGSVVSIWDRGSARPHVVTGGWHHMGTTMMSSDPRSGVVDANCQVYGIDNLFVAGSSVFATSGYANPTLSLLALAIRLGRHLIESSSLR